MRLEEVDGYIEFERWLDFGSVFREIVVDLAGVLQLRLFIF